MLLRHLLLVLLPSSGAVPTPSGQLIWRIAVGNSRTRLEPPILETLLERFFGTVKRHHHHHHEATTIAHGTRQVLAVIMVFGTSGVFKIGFWRNTPSALPTVWLLSGSLRRQNEVLLICAKAGKAAPCTG
jgi:hypothetical protein